MNSDLSKNGEEMVSLMQTELKEQKFFTDKKIPDVALVSTLTRAQKTFDIGVAPVLPKVPVIRTDKLIERRIPEYMWAKEGFRNRVREFEDWLDHRNERVVLIVGHSQFFRQMLGKAASVRKFSNCDIWEYERIHDQGQGWYWKEIGRRYTSSHSEKFDEKKNEK
mmetsp:Transcript_14329/g.21771  ORF Transcript_14329/g.21771 Transcript_14329/m.21771 type:complete len:165 (+) Transcript_14329:381-875(+)|eukprot:CAMPEP_0167744618 /NCGR_PEP_ID=MMETSP0110_2-20121227/2693_1 /TAXON_ID=629695 /ORGANISM="Gymnochlora sp., Strain CCMP2014" /LENGTH=164 /DNA_ID=CAMNT_0007629163 /DNA_START=293 /DNA_END=787 /DNA_ORIENTATION=+